MSFDKELFVSLCMNYGIDDFDKIYGSNSSEEKVHEPMSDKEFIDRVIEIATDKTVDKYFDYTDAYGEIRALAYEYLEGKENE